MSYRAGRESPDCRVDELLSSVDSVIFCVYVLSNAII